jgi:hypothetical protein
MSAGEIISMSEDIKGYKNVNSEQHQNSCTIPDNKTEKFKQTEWVT